MGAIHIQSQPSFLFLLITNSSAKLDNGGAVLTELLNWWLVVVTPLDVWTIFRRTQRHWRLKLEEDCEEKAVVEEDSGGDQDTSGLIVPSMRMMYSNFRDYKTGRLNAAKTKTLIESIYWTDLIHFLTNIYTYFFKYFNILLTSTPRRSYRSIAC